MRTEFLAGPLHRTGPRADGEPGPKLRHFGGLVLALQALAGTRIPDDVLGGEDYADEILNTLEVNLSKFIAAVQRGRERLQGKDEPAEVR